MKKLILSTLKDQLQYHLENHNEYLIIRSLLLNHIGQPINEQLKIAEGYQIKAFANGFYATSPRGVDHYICAHSECDNFTIDQFDVIDAIHNQTAERNANSLQALINNPDALVRVFSRIVRAKLNLHAAIVDLKSNQSFTLENPAYQAILDRLNIKRSFINSMYDNSLN